MTLLECKIRSVYIIDEIKVEGNTGRRLLSLGLIHGTKIQIINRKRNGAVILKARGSRFALGRQIACNIIVSENSDSAKESQP